MINELSRNHIFFRRYFPPEPSSVSDTPHSHDIVKLGMQKLQPPLSCPRAW